MNFEGSIRTIIRQKIRGLEDTQVLCTSRAPLAMYAWRPAPQPDKEDSEKVLEVAS